MFYNNATDKQDQYRTAVVDTLVAEVQSVPGDNRCVLLLGYEDKMRDMFLNVNPGLGRRFQIDDPFKFEDYTLPELLEILQHKMAEQDLTATPLALQVASDILQRTKMRPNFSNAGEVEMLLSSAKLNCQERLSKLPPEDRMGDPELRPEDFDPQWTRQENAIQKCRELLKGQVGDNIIQKLEHLQLRAKNATLRGHDPRKVVPTNFIFLGNPGTGKTTTARNMGQIFYDMGFLSTSEVVECSASELIGQYVGQTGPKTRLQLERGLGKVLLVDEAYRLTNGQYATEACNELIHQLSQARFNGKMVIILAGYPADMRELLRLRPGLAGHFPEVIEFHNIPPEDCLRLLARELAAMGVHARFLSDQDCEEYMKLCNLFKFVSIFPSWHNARDIKNLAKRMGGFVQLGTPKPPAPAPLTCREPGGDAEMLDLKWEQALQCMKAVVHEHRLRYGRDLDPDDDDYTLPQPGAFGEISALSGVSAPGCADQIAEAPQEQTAADAATMTQSGTSAGVDVEVAAGPEAQRAQRAPVPPPPVLPPLPPNYSNGPGPDSPTAGERAGHGGAAQEAEAEAENIPHCVRIAISASDEHAEGSRNHSNAVLPPRSIPAPPVHHNLATHPLVSADPSPPPSPAGAAASNDIDETATDADGTQEAEATLRPHCLRTEVTRPQDEETPRARSRTRRASLHPPMKHQQGSRFRSRSLSPFTREGRRAISAFFRDGVAPVRHRSPSASTVVSATESRPSTEFTVPTEHEISRPQSSSSGSDPQERSQHQILPPPTAQKSSPDHDTGANSRATKRDRIKSLFRVRSKSASPPMKPSFFDDLIKSNFRTDETVAHQYGPPTKCPENFAWDPLGDGTWQCQGGSHFWKDGNISMDW
ncbi:hypothetical protein BDZ91DRAFT_850709 [Kalaharituber pfeilii]|nr:hypothetical protein BDZ91DRAFT_850709 [Kalaharituber pfeilii]